MWHGFVRHLSLIECLFFKFFLLTSIEIYLSFPPSTFLSYVWKDRCEDLFKLFKEVFKSWKRIRKARLNVIDADEKQKSLKKSFYKDSLSLNITQNLEQI